jgi:hypothetical protein
VAVVLPVTPFSDAVIVALPALCPVASPPAVIVTAAVEALQLTCDVMFYVPPP